MSIWCKNIKKENDPTNKSNIPLRIQLLNSLNEKKRKKFCLWKLFIFIIVLIFILFLLDFILKYKNKHNLSNLNKEKNSENDIDTMKYYVNVKPASLTYSGSAGKGIIICLHDGIISLGLSLIKELRCLGNTRPIQIYYCFPDELTITSQKKLLKDPLVELIDVCTDLVERGTLTRVLAYKFRSFWIKPLSLLHTTFQEVMILDADDIFRSNPDRLWNNPGYKRTGTLFFYDRVVDSNDLFNRVVKEEYNIRWIEAFIREEFKIDPYRSYNGVGNRVHNESQEKQPSEELVHSLAWQSQTCHHQDSSLVLWNKAKQERAMHIIWELITKTKFEVDYSYGDKETFWLSCELAKSEYYFSPWGVASVSGYEDMKLHPKTMCGPLAQYFPSDEDSNMPAELLYINGRALVSPYVTRDLNEMRKLPIHNLYNEAPTHISPRSKRKKLEKHDLGQECMFNLGAEPLDKVFLYNLARRRVYFTSLTLGTDYGLDYC